MHVIKTAVDNANLGTCPPNPSSGTIGAPESVQTKMSEPIRFAMGGGKLYSLYQKALNSMSPITFNFLRPAFIVPDKKIVEILHDFQNNTFIQQYLQSRNKENIQLREKINQFFLLQIQEQSLIKNDFLSEMITILGTELKSEKIFSDLFQEITKQQQYIIGLTTNAIEIGSLSNDTFKSIFDIILELSTVLPRFDDISSSLYDLYEPVTEFFLTTFIPNLPIDGIKLLLTNFESIRFHCNNNLLLASMYEPVNPAADADFGMFYEDTALGATSCMTVCMILQLALKDLIDVNVIRSTIEPSPIEPWINSEIDIGNSCIGTPPVTLSSLRIVINNSVPFYNDIFPETGSPYPGCIPYILSGANLQKLVNVKSTISPFDFVQKGSLIAYIKHILEAVNTFGMLYTYKRDDETNIKVDITPITPDQINIIAKELSDYCMITDECCSTPLKGIFDIFYTLFIIENFANRALVTQKINKELKRVAICAKVLFLHYKLLDPSSHNIEIQDMLNILLEMCSFSFSQVPFSLNNESQMIYIMNKYVEFVNMIANFALQSLPFLFFCKVPKVTNLSTHETTDLRTITSIERTFYNLLGNSSKDNKKKDITYDLSPNTKDISTLTKCIPCVLDILNKQNKQDSKILEMLNNNKQYCAECDTANKSSGRIILSSAYQSVLWSTKNYKTISKTRPQRIVSGLFDLYEKESTASTGTTFNDFISELMGILFKCTTASEPAKTVTEILKLDNGNGNGIEQIITQENASPYFQFLCWFLTCVFGVKAKSKKQKISSLTRKYLSLIDEKITDLFGFTITITERTKDLLKSPTDTPKGTTSDDEDGKNSTKSGECITNPKDVPEGYLYLAYDVFTGPMAYNKYYEYAKEHPSPETDTHDLMGAVKESTQSNPPCDIIRVRIGIAIKPNTPVMDFILTDLSGRFEKLPAGISKIIAVSEKMRSVLLNFLESCKSHLSVQKYLCSLSEDSFADILYVPGSHDAKKFFELQPGERTLWLRYLIDKIRISEIVVDDGTGKPDPNDRFFCIKLLFLLIKYLILPEISFATPCNNILTVDLLSGLSTTPEELGIPLLTQKINNYYDKCGQIERQQKVNALNADRKGITLTAVCAVPKKSSKSLKTFAETTVNKIAELVKKDTVTNKKEIEAEAADVVSQLLQNLLVPKQKITKKSTKKEQGNVVTTSPANPIASKKRQAISATEPTFSAPATAPSFGATLSTALTPALTPVAVNLTKKPQAGIKQDSGTVLFTTPDQPPLALERQNQPLSCGRHALNNLLRGPFFTFDTKAVDSRLRLDQISRPPPSINLQQVCYSMVTEFDTLFFERVDEYCRTDENHDVTLLMVALSLLGYSLDQSGFKSVDEDFFSQNKDFHLLVNKGNNHWVAVRKYSGDNSFYLYDSLETKVLQFKNLKELINSFKKTEFFIYNVVYVGQDEINIRDRLLQVRQHIQVQPYEFRLGQPLFVRGQPFYYVERFLDGDPPTLTGYGVARDILTTTPENQQLFQCVQDQRVLGVPIFSKVLLSQVIPQCLVGYDTNIQIFLFGDGSYTPETSRYMYPSEKAPFILCKGYEIVPVGSVIAAAPPQLQTSQFATPTASAAFGSTAQPASEAFGSSAFGAFGAPAQLGAPPAALTSESNSNFVFTGDTDMNLTASTDINVLKPPVKSTLAGVGNSRKSGVVKLGSQKLAGEKKDPKAVASKPLAEPAPAQALAFGAQQATFAPSTPFGTQPFPSFSSAAVATPPPTSAASTSAPSPSAASTSTASPFAAFATPIAQQTPFTAPPPTSAASQPLAQTAPFAAFATPIAQQTPFTAPPPTSAAFAAPTQASEVPQKNKKRDFSQVDDSTTRKGAIATFLPKNQVVIRKEETTKKQKSSTEGGSPTISIPTPSKTRKSHQRKRSNSSNKSTFKRRKYTEE
jgi:hypothetical protein